MTLFSRALNRVMRDPTDTSAKLSLPLEEPTCLSKQLMNGNNTQINLLICQVSQVCIETSRQLLTLPPSNCKNKTS